MQAARRQATEQKDNSAWHSGCNPLLTGCGARRAVSTHKQVHGEPNRSRQKETSMPTPNTKSGTAKPRRSASSARSRKTAAPRQRDAITILRADHKLVDEMFKQYEKTRAETRKQTLVNKICAELTAHTTVEEEIFYPAVRGAIKDTDLMDEADVEHASAKELIAQLQAGKPGDDHYDAKVKVLGEYIRHHVKEEQNEMFPKAKKTKLDMMELGAQIETRKAELQMQQQPKAKEAGKSKSSVLSGLSMN